MSKRPQSIARGPLPAMIAAATAALAVGFIAGMTALPAAASGPSITAPATLQIEEDDPRWDCRTMGNKICGAV